MTAGCDGVFSGRKSGGRCIVGICGRPDGRPDWSPPPPPPGGGGSGSGPGGHHGQQSSGSSSLGTSGSSLRGRFFPDGFPRRRHWTLADACLAIVGDRLRPASHLRLLGLLIDRPAAAAASIHPAFGDRASGHPACARRFGVRGSLAAGARSGPRIRSVFLPGFGIAAVSFVSADGVRRWGGMSHRVASPTGQQPGSYQEAGRGDAPTRTHFGTTLHTHRHPQNLRPAIVAQTHASICWRPLRPLGGTGPQDERTGR